MKVSHRTHPRNTSTPVATLLALSLLAVGCGGGGDGGDDSNPDADEETAALAWEGNTYLLEVPSGNWTEPRGIGRDIGPFVPRFLIRVDGASDGTIDVTLGTAVRETETQEMCNPTHPVQGSIDAEMNVQIGPTDFPVHLKHTTEPIQVNATIREISFTNVLPSDGQTEGQGQLIAVMDFREVIDLFTLLAVPEPMAACNALESTFDAPCEACPQDDESFCLSLTAEELVAAESTIDMQDVAASSLGAECENMSPDDEATP